MTRFYLFLFPILFIGSMAFSQTYYLRFDPDCMDRYEFVTDIDKTPYVVYGSHSPSGSLIQLDVGKEPVKWAKELPGKLTDCFSFNFNKGFAKAVNNGKVKIYIVRESPTHYNIAPVEKANYFIANDLSMNVSMQDVDFTLNWEKMISNRNLATPSSEKEMFLEGTIKYNCLTGYIFRKKDSYNSESFKEYTIIPEIGIINKRSAPNADAITNSLKLDRVGQSSMIEFVSDICSEIPSNTVAAEEIKEPYPTTYKEDEVVAKRPAEVPTSYANNSPCSSSNKAGVHVVQKGETLYSISKRYGITVDQLRKLNGVSSKNIISLCQELRVVASTTATSTSTTQPKGNATGNVETTPQDYHIVKPNQTVYQLASMYGFTEERFRQMNGLGEFERIYAGQKLYTSDCDCPNREPLNGDYPMPYEGEQIETPVLTARGNPDVYFRPVKIHVVKGGESLFAISKQYDTSVERLKELNNLQKNAKLNKGQSIYVQ